MGVHDKNRYSEIKEALGIPDDEPIFIIRGKDRLAPAMVEVYEVLYTETAKVLGLTSADVTRFADEISDVWEEVHQYQREHPELVKFPD